VLDLSKTGLKINKKYDLIFSRMTGEHIRDAEIVHKNIYQMINPGGYSVHCFSTLYSLPFLINKLTPDFLSDFLLKIFAPRDEHKHGKFKAYYNWSQGPTKKMINRFKEIGFEIVQYSGYFGHYYYKKIPILRNLEAAKSKLLLKHPNPYLTSYALLVLRRPYAG
jgi:2-polyprenyl-3-methyl-5-hydroxy-6-metoxy-1,4-benzoquinol methylase